MTPTTVCGSPLSRMVAPTTEAVGVEHDRHSRSLSTATARTAGAIFVGGELAAHRRRTPSTRKYPALTRCGATLMARSPATRLTRADRPEDAAASTLEA